VNVRCFVLLCAISAYFTNAYADCYDELRDDRSKDSCEEGAGEENTLICRLEKAIAHVNRLVDDDALKLALLNTDETILESSELIPVSSVDFSRSDGVIAQVPVGCREIVIGGNEFNEAVVQAIESEAALSTNQHQMLVILLLHELGHVAAGHYGKFVSIDNGEPIVNQENNVDKVQEQIADQFIVEQLRPQQLLAESCEMDFDHFFLILFLSQLSFEIAGEASIRWFGLRPLNGTEIFWDHSFTHENLEYRLLKINHAIAQSDLSAQLLADFEAGRAATSPAGILLNPE